MAESPGVWERVLADVLAGSHLATDDGVPALLDRALAPLGIGAEVLLIDHEQLLLRALRPGAVAPVRADGTLPGRAYQLTRVLAGHDEQGSALLWVPLLDGVERFGLLRLRLPDDADARDAGLHERAVRLAALAAHILASKQRQGDAMAVARRTHPMSVASELLWQLLPPLTFGCPGLALSAVLSPAYEVSGDAFDYAVTDQRAHFALFDPAGHDLQAGLTAAVTLAAARAARREGHDLEGVAARVDTTLTAEFADFRFVTGVLLHLDLDTGRLRYLNAGHPPPVLLRGGRRVRELDGGGRLPFGRVAGLAPWQSAGVGEEDLQPGDRLLLYSDGVVEAVDAAGEEFGVERLVELAEHSAAAELAAPETLRRLARAVQDYQGGELRDDATLMLVEWSGRGAERLLVQGVDA